MERRLKERLIGAAVLVMLAVILIPMILDDSSDAEITITETNIPARPADDFSSRIVPLKESDLTPLPVEQAMKTEVKEEEPVADELAAASVEEMSEANEEEPAATEDRQKNPSSNKMGVTAWVVQLGSFSSEENASGLNEKLRKAGYPAFVEPLNTGPETSYRVRVGPEILRSDALALKQKLKKNLQIDGIIIRYP